jgi:serine phosphatase RsbU (regulator of sigma subunit)
MAVLNWLIFNDHSHIPQKAGTILELIVFTFGISLRYKALEEEKRRYQQQVIEQLEENTRIQDKANRDLEGKVRERTREISEKNEILLEQNEEIKAQSDLLLLQHESIQESIRYASRIQTAILPADASLQHFLPKHFILFKPRDVVSGDFYWLGSKGDKIIIAAVDCTGHGVPGAFMSMLGSSLLNQIVNTLSLISPHEILNELRERIILALKQTGKAGEAKDGMDMGLCTIDRTTNTLEFSGSNNNLIIIREGSLTELKGDRMPIGISHLAGKSFSKQVFDLKKGDSIYLHSDGFPDQFGGPKGKKFLTARFKQLLLDIQDQIMFEQKETLERSLLDWMNPSNSNTETYEQVDDILVIGIRI